MRKQNALKRAVAFSLIGVMCAGNTPVYAWPEQETAAIEAEEGRETLNFNQGWKFVRQNIPEAVNVDYDMEELKRWENVDLPHTVREEPYNNSGGINYQGPAMYRKHFSLPESYRGKKLYIEFEGVMGVTDVWVNGQHLQGHMAEKTGDNTQYGGYLPFVLDITDVVHCDGQQNVITVLTDNSDNENVPPGKPQGQLDFTYFGGIYRNVWMHSVNNVHITDELYEDEVAGGGVFVDYPEVPETQATVEVKTHVRNEEAEETEVRVVTKVEDKEGNVVASAEEDLSLAGENAEYAQQTLTVEDPELWNLDTPYLYTLVSEIYQGDIQVDTEETRIGIRQIEMSPGEGILLNGEPVGYLSGVNRHQEYPYVGHGASDALQRRDAIKYKSAGFNVVRTAHHPQAEAFLEACDELGILVIEAVPGWQHWSDDWTFAERIRLDIRQMVRRDRNHPCILTYETSLNETPGVPEGFTNELSDVAKEEHPSVHTSAENPHAGANADMLYGKPDEVASWSDKAVSFIREYGDLWEEQFGEFDNSCRVTRGEGTFYPGGEARMVEQANNRLWEGYHFNGTGAISLSEGIKNYKDSNRRFAGTTMWIGIDHNRGGHETMSPCGIWDLMRIPKYSYYAFASQRPAEENLYLESRDVETGPLLFVASSWGDKAPVYDKMNGETLGTDEKRIIYVYSNAETVKLSVMGEDGETLWEKTNQPLDEGTSQNLDHPPFRFEEVPYTAGSYLLAEGYDAEGNKITEQEVHTAGEPAQIVLEADESGTGLTADGSDMVMVYAKVLDKDGNLCQEATNQLNFSVEGEGSIVADGDKRVGANPVKAEAGQTGIYVRAGKTAGDITVSVNSAGLEGDSITIQSAEMKDKVVPYEEIEQGAPMDQASMYLTEKEETVPGDDAPSVSKENITVGEETYEHSMKVKNMAPVLYELEGGYERLTGKAAILNPENESQKMTFRIYGDDALLYTGETDGAGVLDLDVDVSGVQTLKLCAGDERATNRAEAGWLSLYVTEGQGETDESELRENVALHGEVTASGYDEGAEPEKAVDGDVLTLWRSADKVSEDNQQHLLVDLGDTYDIRNARLAVEHDYLKCTYTIYTSPDKENWTEQTTTSKTAHGNEDLDCFQAAGVRYVAAVFTKVESTQGESGGSQPKASVKELEIYRDKGVETVKDYNLAGLSVAGQDLVFEENQTEYEISLAAPENEVWVKAFPANVNSTVYINGEKLETAYGSSLSDISYMKAVPDENSNVVVKVVSPDEKGEKEYVIHVNTEDVQETYDALAGFVPGRNGANGWTYGKIDANSGEISQIENDMYGYIAGEQAFSGGSGWLYAGPRYMHPAVDAHAVRTFEAPKDGYVTIRGLAEKYQGQGGKVLVSVTLNGEKIWPSNKEKEDLYENEVLKINIGRQVQKGDQIQYILESDWENGHDATYMETSVVYEDAERQKETYLSDLTWESAYAGYGDVNCDVSSGGGQIRLTDEKGEAVGYEKGIGTHATSKIVYDIAEKGYTAFRSFVGVDYSQRSATNLANVRFKVYLENENTEPIFDSGEMLCDTPQQKVNVKIPADTKKVILVVEEGEGNWEDHANWADAKFVTEEEEPEPPVQEIDIHALEMAVTMAEKLQKEQEKHSIYTEDTWAGVQTALDNAKTLLNNPEAAQEDVDSAFLELMTAINLLESDVQKAGLGAAIEGAKAILADASALADYTPESVEAVRSALAEAEAVYADTEATQTAINQAAANLMTAVNNLLVTETDNRLDILIQKAEELLQKEDQYTNDSVQALKDALEAAKEAAAKKDATEQEINDAYNALAEAMASLVRVANKDELKNALDKANEILTNAGKYTDSSLEGLQEAKDAAQGVYDNDNATQEEIEEALKALINEILEVRLLGDVNLDEVVDSADAQALLRYNAELEELSEEQLDAADVNRDEAADSSDAGRILQYAAEMIEEF